MSQHNGDHQSSEPAAEALTALALNQLQGEERASAEAQLAGGGDAAQREVREIQTLAAAFTAARNSEPLPPPSAELRKSLEERLVQVELPPKHWPSWGLVTGVSILSLAALLIALLWPPVQSAREASRHMQAGNRLVQAAQGLQRKDHAAIERSIVLDNSASTENHRHLIGRRGDVADYDKPKYRASVQDSLTADPYGINESAITNNPLTQPSPTGSNVQLEAIPAAERNGNIVVSSLSSILRAKSGNAQGQPVAVDPTGKLPSVAVTPRIIAMEEELAAVTEARKLQDDFEVAELVKRVKQHTSDPREQAQLLSQLLKQPEGPGTEQYERIIENAFLSPRQQPLSTFSIDVDTASYANVRRFLTSGRLPPVNSVRIEELVNYFKYDYPQPKSGEPFSVNMEVAECPWQTGHLLLRVGLKGKEVVKSERPASNLVFLLDVSGSMSDENKLPLLKSAMKLLVGELGENDRVSIVTYAGEAGLRLAPTRGHERGTINAAIDSLSANGSTNGSAGINLAYEQAAAYFAKGGTNRVILCTDGDLNVGITSDDALVELIKQKAAGGTFLTVLGFGEGNLKDAKLEKLADNGNGLYAYIDSVREARRVLVEQLTGSTITIAKDVKIQIEFNPQEVAAYRLLGYENRVLAAEDFSNDKKDAGEIGAGHSVTALYELVPAGAAEEAAPAAQEQLKYQRSEVRGQKSEIADHRPPTPDSRLTDAAKSGELLTLKLRYKEPEGTESRLIEYSLKDRGGAFHAASRDMQFAASVASFGMILRGSQYRGSGNLPAVLEIASTSLGEDAGGYRAEFVDLVRKAQALGAR